MTTLAELPEVLGFHPETPRIRALGTQAVIVREADSPATAVAIVAQLLRLTDQSPSGKLLYLQLQPPDALGLATSIFAHAVERGWTIDGDLLELVQRVRVPPSGQRH